MDTLEIALIAALVLTVIGSTLIIISVIRKNQEKPQDDKSMLMLQNQINAMSKLIDEKFQYTTKTIDQKLDRTNQTLLDQYGKNSQMIQRIGNDSGKTIRDVTEKLTKLDETNKKVMDVATQLQSLENVLKNPKHRGILGEIFLEDILSQTLPQGTYQMQYKFQNGEIVDAAILFKDVVIPIDAKFSLEKYNEIQQELDKGRRETLEKGFKNDLKTRIEETSKYVRPEEGTTEFAFMFIPAEGIFYNLLMHKVGTVKVSSDDLIEFAFRQKVVIVSPNTLFAYLQTIRQALNFLKVNQYAKEISSQIKVLAKHLSNYNDYFQKVGKHLGTTVSAYNSATAEFGKIDKDVYKISGGTIGAEQLALSKPEDKAV